GDAGRHKAGPTGTVPTPTAAPIRFRLLCGAGFIPAIGGGRGTWAGGSATPAGIKPAPQGAVPTPTAAPIRFRLLCGPGLSRPTGVGAAPGQGARRRWPA